VDSNAVAPVGRHAGGVYLDRIAATMTARGGVARAATLIAAGARRSDLRRHVAAGELVRVREGVYALPSADEAVRIAAAHGGALACVSALRRYGVWLLSEPGIHVWLGDGGRAHPHAGCGCTVHWDAGHAEPGMVGIERALVQIATCQGDEAFFVAFESAWRLGMIDRGARRVIRAHLPARMRYLVDLARGDADSGLESLVRLRLARLGITVRSQVAIAGVGRVDFLIDGRIILEIDGRENHEGVTMRHKDLRRDAAAAARGYVTLRFDYALVVHEWATVLGAILGARDTFSRRTARP